MITDIIILAAVIVYSGFVIRRHMKNAKNPGAGCGGCSCCKGNCCGGDEKSYCNLNNTEK